MTKDGIHCYIFLHPKDVLFANNADAELDEHGIVWQSAEYYAEHREGT